MALEVEAVLSPFSNRQFFINVGYFSLSVLVLVAVLITFMKKCWLPCMIVPLCFFQNLRTAWRMVDLEEAMFDPHNPMNQFKMTKLGCNTN